VMRQHAAASPH